MWYGNMVTNVFFILLLLLQLSPHKKFIFGSALTLRYYELFLGANHTAYMTPIPKSVFAHGKLKSQPRPMHVVHVKMKQQTIVLQELEHRKQHCVCYWWWIRASVYFSTAEDSRKTDVTQLAPVSVLCPERSMSYICCIIHSTLHSPSALDIMWSHCSDIQQSWRFLCGTADVGLLYYYGL